MHGGEKYVYHINMELDIQVAKRSLKGNKINNKKRHHIASMRYYMVPFLLKLYFSIKGELRLPDVLYFVKGHLKKIFI